MNDRTPHLFIATPTADGIMLCDYVASVVRLSGRLRERGIGVTYRSLDGIDLILQRNLLAEAFLASPCTHLLFVDSDMDFAPDLAERLLAADKAVIGAIYPKRALDLAALGARLRSRAFPDALALTYSWNTRILGPTVTVLDGICRVDGLGGGFLLIRRECFETLLARTDVPFVRGGPRPGTLRAFFRDMPQGNDVLDLDYAFCRRWIDCGGEVWAYPGAEIRHCGDDRAGMPFARALGALQDGTGRRAELVLSPTLAPA